MRTFSLSLLGMICCLASACGKSKTDPSAASSKPTQPSAVTAPAVKPPRTLGQLVPAEPVAGTADGSYAYYLPQNYSVDHPIPVLIFFDSHARGKDPVRRYQRLAEQYGLLLVGSNNSKNGQQPNQGLSIYDQLITDLQLKFAIDAQRITVSGFSGGARVAATIAQNRPAAQQVIACSAGFQPRQGDSFSYYAIVGKKDFNYQELRQLEDALDATPQRHIVRYWDGGHEWPSAEVMADAVEFTVCRSLAPDAMVLDSLVGELRRRLGAQLKSSGDDLTRGRAYQHFIAKLDGLADVSKEKQALEAIQNGKGWADGRSAENKEAEEEMALRNEYVPLLGTKSIAEWRGIVGKLNPTSKPKGSAAYFLHHRVLNFLSLNTYFQVDGAMKAGDLPTAEHFLQIYALVDPTNPESPYLTAALRMRQNRPAEAIDALQAAQRLGFKDADRMAADPDFVGLRRDTKFVQVLEQIRSL